MAYDCYYGATCQVVDVFVMILACMNKTILIKMTSDTVTASAFSVSGPFNISFFYQLSGTNWYLGSSLNLFEPPFIFKNFADFPFVFLCSFVKLASFNIALHCAERISCL